MLVVPVFVVYSFFFYCLFPFFGIPEAAWAAWTELTPFRQLSLLFLCDGEYQNQIKAKNTYAGEIM